MKKQLLLILFAILVIMPGWARKRQATKKPKALPAIVRNFPSGAIDEYHFRQGNIVIRGYVKNARTENGNSTFNLSGRNLFTNKPLVTTICTDSTGHFCNSFMIPHTQFFMTDNFEFVFAAVGDTLDMVIDKQADTDNVTITCGGTGATGEVNRVWPLLRKQFLSSDLPEMPWKEKDRQVMLDWKNDKLKEMNAIAMVIDADTIGLLHGCSSFAKDVLKSSLLACITEQIGEAFHQYQWRVMDEQRKTPPEKVIRITEIWDFLQSCETYLLDNPCMLFAMNADYMINHLEFGPLRDYLFLGNAIRRECNSNDADFLVDYKLDFILPATYTQENHKILLDCRNDTLLSVADYYQMATDSIRSRFGLSNNFMMQICLLHCIFNDDDMSSEDYHHMMAERFAGAIPQITDKIVSRHAVEAYRKFVVRHEVRTPAASTSPAGDSIFNSLVEKYKGNVIVMDFWELSCAPCRMGMLEQRSDVEYFRDKPVRFLYLCNEQNIPREQSESFMNDNDIRGEHIYLTADEWNHLSMKFQFIGIPFHIIVDKNGNILKQKASRYMIEELLKE